MRYFKIFVLLVAIVGLGTNTSCERDDICHGSTPTTPKLIIELYDSASPENAKFATKLRVQGVGNPDFLTVSINDVNSVTRDS